MCIIIITILEYLNMRVRMYSLVSTDTPESTSSSTIPEPVGNLYQACC